MLPERVEYDSPDLDVADLDPDPFRQFQRWLDDAITAAVPEPEAFVLATVSSDGAPSSRTLLLKGFENDQLVFYTNYQSRKALDLEHESRVAALFLWLPIHRQVRIEGSVTKVDPARSDAYFASRPPESRLASAASPQSSVMGSRAELDALLAHLIERFPDGNVPRPPHWGGYSIAATSYEFWQGRRARFHDRFRYRIDNDSWTIERLAP
jgi:pyridoxamine 5'-phosphate oxidase